MEDGDYVFDHFDDGSSKLVGDGHISRVKEFLDSYSERLRGVEEALSDSLSDIWDPNQDPIKLHIQPYEQCNMPDLINTESKLFNKVILVFSTLCKESRVLVRTAEEKYFAPLLLFGQEYRDEPAEGDAQAQIGRMLPFLHELSFFVNRAYSVIQNIMRQLASLYNPKEKLYQQSFKNIHLNTVFYCVSELLTCLITLDEIVTQNQNLKKAWAMYKRMTKTIKQEPERYNTTEEKLLQFEKLLLSFEGQLFDGLIFQNCIEQEFDFPGLVDVRSNQIFEKEFFLNVRAMYTRMTDRNGDLNEIFQRKNFVGLCALYVFYFNLFRNPADKKFFKAIWEMYRVIPIIHLYGNVSWFSTEFLKKKVEFMVKNAIGPITELPKFFAQYLADLDKNLETDISKLYLTLSKWMVRMESKLINRADTKTIISTRISLLFEGLRIAYEIADTFKKHVYLHTYLKKPIKPSHIRPLCQCVEMLKAISFTFHRRSAMIGESIIYMIQQLQFSLQRTFYPIKESLEAANKSYSDQWMDILSAANLALQQLNSVSTEERRLLLRLSMHVLFQLQRIKDEHVEEIKSTLRMLDILCNVERVFTEACDCSFFYFSRILITPYFTDIFNHPDQAQKLQYMFAAFRDIVPVFNTVHHLSPKEFLDIYDNEITKSLENNLILPVCRAIEEDLRFHIHTHLDVSVRDPFKQGVKDLNSLIHIKPLRFFNRTIDIKAHVTHYLDKTFYNLTTVALYDWKTYAEMRNLANEKYDLHLTEVHLPGQTLEQGVDVLEIMRNIHIFVSKYHYNLNNQIFMERQSDSKFLNTVNIGHIANSLRTHGSGIMNTTVNFTYQFLVQKFVIFSQFLFDDHIKSRLFKDIRYFKENKEKLDNKYPAERAEKFTREIRKLGLNQDGSSFLDAFRVLITEIGNAMGYIRMVRSGGFSYTSNAIKFVPDLKEVHSFEELVVKSNLSPTTREAAHNLDLTVNTLAKNFAEGTDYFKLLVSVFATEFRSEQNMHLRNFHAIVPPLTLSFVSHMLVSKDKMKTKKGVFQPTCFTDDGFAIGIAYILKLLDLNSEFDSLHWFESITIKYNEESQKLNNLVQLEKKGVKKMNNEQQTALLTLKKISAFQHEFELLRYSFSGARIFFKD